MDRADVGDLSVRELSAPQPPVDAARLDIMPAQLWGRAEGVRTTLRGAAEAIAPTLFGYLSQYVFGGPGSSGSGSPNGHQPPSSAPPPPVAWPIPS